MPPPKKPKNGPITMEQFMERGDLSDDDRSRKESFSGESDVSVSGLSTRRPSVCSADGIDTFTNQAFSDDKSPGLKLLRDLILKKQEATKDCKDGLIPKSENNTLKNGMTENKCDNGALPPTPEEYEGLNSDKKDTCRSNSSGSPVLLSGEEKMSLSQTIQESISKNEKILNSIVVSSLMPTVPRPQGIHSMSGYLSPYLYSRSMTAVNPYLSNEPRDLSTKLHTHPRLTESLYGSDPVSAYGSGQYGQVSPERKEFLDSRKNLVGILTESRYGQNSVGLRIPSSIHERDAFSFYLNGFDSARDSIDKLSLKDDSLAGGYPGGYLLPHMMPSQLPSSTTSPHDGRMLTMLDGSLSFTNTHKLKHEIMSSGSGHNKLCQVCSDNASGFHYGVWSCEGCKAFFKRSIQGPVDYVCPATNSCTIDKHRRKSCQACRLRKCYEVGMNKGTQRKERKPSANSKLPTKRNRADSTDNIVNSTSGSPNPAKSPRRSETSAILDALSKADMPIVESYHNHNMPPSRTHLLNSLVKLAERELVQLINWAKNVPGYIDLSLSDQVHLIECCWMELLLLNCTFRSMSYNGKRLVFAPDFVLDRSHWEVMGMTEIFEQVSAVSENFIQYQLHKNESLLLQATVLVNAEVRRLTSCDKIHRMRQSILDAVVDTAQKYHPDNLRHVPSILLMLTHIRQAGTRAIAYFQKLKQEGTVTFSDLLKEMLDSQDYTEIKTENPTT
ncbi:estrogen receptor-like isoform X1 [Mytilus trossulus]|uniref:estrogen receptor-like isoform X1 n=1 Tax=Mytilus trossulus TaxID=6551 RepID=UPI003003C27A